MRKTLLLLTLLCALTASAQKRLKSFSAPLTVTFDGQAFTVNMTGDLSYDSNGDLSVLKLNMGMMGTTQEFLSVNYIYGENDLMQTYTSDGEEAMSTEAALTNGLATSLTYNIDGKSYPFTLTYNDGKLASIEGTNEDSTLVRNDLTWENGNLKSETVSENGTATGRLDFTYGTVRANEALNAIIAYMVESPLMENSLIALTPVKYYGLASAYAPEKITVSELGGEDSNTQDINIAYTQGADGLPSGFNISGIELELDEDIPPITSVDVSLTWEDDPTSAIAGVSTTAETQPMGYYTLDGRSLDKPAHGLNIVRYADGTSKKVIVK